MLNREINLLEEYGLHVEKTSRGRGGTIAYCQEGIFLLKGYAASEKRAEFIWQVLTDWEKQGLLVDTFVRNKDGKLLVSDLYQNVYVLRKWFGAQESDVMNPGDVQAGVNKLVELQKMASDYKIPEEAVLFPAKKLSDQLAKHNRELKNVYNYVGNKKQKNEFEEMFRGIFGKCYESACQAIKLAGEIPADQCKMQICHKDYTHHNLLVMGDEMPVVNFDNMAIDSRVSDFTQYLRKIMEKHIWDVELGEKMITAFVQESDLTKGEREELYIRMLYPIRFWKIVNHYSNTRKTWVSLRNKEKLELFWEQEERRQQFLVFLRSLMYNV